MPLRPIRGENDFELEMAEAEDESAVEWAPQEPPPAPERTENEDDPDEGAFDLSFGIEIEDPVGTDAGIRETESTGFVPPTPQEHIGSGLSSLKDPAPMAEKRPLWKRTVTLPAYLVVAVVVLAMVSGLAALRGLESGAAPSDGITVIDPRGRIVDNIHTGMIFVIDGQVRNDAGSSRRRIGILGRIYTKTGFAKAVRAYGGYEPSETELTTADLAPLLDRLASPPLDPAGGDIRLSSGQNMPFTLVFSGLPPDLSVLEKFTVEVTGAVP